MKQILLFLTLSCSGMAKGQTPQLVVPVGHSGYVTQAVFSNNSKMIATTAEDNAVKIWSIPEGRLLATLYGHRNYVNRIYFSKNDRYLATISSDAVAFVWDLDAGTRHLVFDTTNSKDHFPVFSNNSKYLAIETKSGVEIWDIALAKKIRAIPEHSEKTLRIYFSNDDRTIITAGYEERQIRFRDMATGKINKIINSRDKVYDLHLLRDGRTLAFTNSSGTGILDMSSGKIIRQVRTDTIFYDSDYVSSSSVITPDGKYFQFTTYQPYEVIGNDTFQRNEYRFDPRIINLLTNKPEKAGSDIIRSDVHDIAYDRNVRHLALILDSFIVVLERVNNNFVLRSRIERSYNLFTDWVAVSNDAGYIATAIRKGTITLHDTKGKKISELRGDISFDKETYFSRDGRYIHSTTANRSRQCWNIREGRFESGCNTDTSYYPSSRNSKDILLKDDITGAWKVISNRDTITLQGYTGSRLFGKPVPGGKWFLTYWDDDDSLRLWNAFTGKLEKSYLYPYTKEPVPNNEGTSIALVKTFDQERITRMWDKMQKELDEEPFTDTLPLPGMLVHVIDILSGDLRFRYIDTTQYEINSFIRLDLGFTDRDDHFMLQGKDVRIWETDKWNQVFYIDHTCGIWNPDLSFNASDNRILLSCGNSTTLYEAGTNQVIFVLPGASVYSNFSDDGKNILTRSRDNQLKVWDASNGKLLYTWYGFSDNNYLVTDQHGHYDGTEVARKTLYFNCGTEVVELAQVKDLLWVPHLAERIMKREVINAPSISELSLCGITPSVKQRQVGAAYYWDISPGKGGIGETILFVNDIEVKKYKLNELQKTTAGYTLSVPIDSIRLYFIAGSDNRISVKAFTSGNTISSRGISITHTENKKAVAPPNLFAIMVGVSDYKGEALDLKYAAKDARDISKAIAASARKLLNTDGKEHVFVYDLTTLPGHYLLPEKKSIQKLLMEIGSKAAANDILMIFFAGHGVTAGDKKQFYFLTADASKDADVVATGISTTELADWIKPSSIKAQKRVLIFDACNSGQAINDLVSIGKGDDQYIAARSSDNSLQVKAIDKLNERSGLFILAASASDQSAYEMGRLSQGLLTHALLKVIREQAGILDDHRFLNVSKWFQAAEKTVEEVVRETGNRQEPQMVSTTAFSIGIVDSEVIAGIVLPTEKPLFTASNFQNSNEDIADDDIELSRHINQALFEVASRGINSSISYVTVTQSPDAYVLSGRYEVAAELVRARVNLKQGRETRFRFEMEGSKNNLTKLASDIVTKASELILQKAGK